MRTFPNGQIITYLIFSSIAFPHYSIFELSLFPSLPVLKPNEVSYRNNLTLFTSPINDGIMECCNVFLNNTSFILKKAIVATCYLAMLVLLSLDPCQAQSPLSSLERELLLRQDSLRNPELAKSVSRQARILLDMATLCEDSLRYGQAVKYLYQLSKLPRVKAACTPKFWYNFSNSLGIDLREIGQYAAAEIWLSEAVRTSESNELGFSGAYINLYDLYIRTNNFVKAQAAASEYIEAAEKAQAPLKVAFGNYIMGRSLIESQNYSSAEQYLNKANQQYLQCKDSSQLGHIFIQRGHIYKYKKEYFLAMKYYELAYKNALRYDPSIVPYALTNEAIIESLQQPQKAVTMLIAALVQFQRSQDKFGEIQCLNHIAEAYLRLGMPQKALGFAQQALNLAISTHDLYNKSKIISLLPEIYAANGLWEKAYVFAQQIRLQKDSQLIKIGELSRGLELKVQEVSYQKKLTDQALQVQRSRRVANFNLIVVVLVTAISIIVFLFYRNLALTTQNRMVQVERDALQKTEELRAFNYTLGHDLKSPIENAQMLLQRFEKQFAFQLSAEASAELLKLKSFHLDAKSFLEGMLTYAQNDQLPFQPNLFETKRVVKSLIDTIREAEPDRNLEFNIGDLPNLYGDSFMLRQVMANLLLNAVKFTSGKTTAVVEINSTSKEEGWEIWVKDNGVGFPAESADRIFELFSTIHDRAVFTGNGIGLAIVKRIIEKHQGKVWAKANPEGGATVGFLIPK